MRIDLNGTSYETPARTLADLIAETGAEAAAVATALDGVFVPRDARAATLLSDGAKVEILAPMQGG
ncbi:sulfur carrier protein ThiS [Celeribacter persicus]|jgi:thiamine biosynthesis protein ThiS|uniref:Sulfur carrier protein n=1 Tax=Celeribacter persicus TaxID=1651082 RepID=A0A2T5H9N1_9RHOB|nr:sulfur carrier protein ThiS [Celeribacter persicus]PTQ68295.1 sulfur carrier protein [Celeribacter persicus]